MNIKRLSPAARLKDADSSSDGRRRPRRRRPRRRIRRRARRGSDT
jgi:hypothetical protein